VFVLVFSLGLVVNLFAQTPSLSPSIVPPAKRLNIAVIPFVGDSNVTPEQLSFITGKFAAELLKTGAFTVLDRGKMDFLLREQGFQQSGACNSSECKVQMGQLLGVDNIVAGNIVKFGPEYAFHIEFIDVTSGQIVNTVEISKSGDLFQVYKSICSQGANKLVEAVLGITLPGASPDIAETIPESTKLFRSNGEPEFSSSVAPAATQAKLAVATPAPSVSKPWAWQTVVGSIGAGVSLLSFGSGAFFNEQARLRQIDRNANQASYDTYIADNYGLATFNSSTADLLWRDYTDNKNKAKAFALYRNICYGFGGFSAAVSGALLLWPSGTGPVVTSRVSAFALPGFMAVQVRF
jgi:TolB-like protein